MTSDLVQLNANIWLVCLRLNQILSTANNCLERFITRNWLRHALIRACIISHSELPTCGACNELQYKEHLQRMKVLRRCRFDSTFHYLYQAVLCYKIAKYSRCLELIQKAKDAIYSGILCI